MSTSRSDIFSALGTSSTRAGVAYVLAGVIGSMVFPIVPFIVGVISDRGAFSARQVGLIGSADMAGMFLAAVLATYWVRGRNWRRIAAISALLLLLANVLTISFDEEFTTLAAARLLAGLGGGSLMALGMAGLGVTRNPDRWFGVFVTSQAVLGAFGAWFIPRYAAPHGLDGIVFFLAAFAATFLPFVPWLPSFAAARESERPRSKRGSIPLAVLALLAAFVFGGGVFAVWVYLERMGRAAGLSGIEIGDVLATSLLAAIAGSVVSTLIGGRCARIWPIASIALAQVTAFALLLGVVERWEFTAAVMLISFLWYFSVPFQLGLTVDVDRTGRFVVLFLVAIKASYAVAPAFVSQFITGEGYGVVAVIGIASAVLAFLIYGPLALLAPGTSGARSASHSATQTL